MIVYFCVNEQQKVYFNSSLRFVKNVYRSSMREERLNALLLLFIHKDIPLDYAAIVDDYAKRGNQRRMAFVNPGPLQ